nr:DUF1593 domain-containing protein [Allomuricauda sp.]
MSLKPSHINVLLFSSLCAGLLLSCSSEGNFRVDNVPNSRVIVLTDMLNEPDDSQTMVRLLMYANRMDIEGLIAVSSCHQYLGKKDFLPVLKEGKVVTVDTVVQERNGVHPQEINKRIEAYAKVLENLKKHEGGWPTPEYLSSRVGSGPAGYGMDDVGVGKSTTGSLLIEEAILKEDERPLYICINAGANTLAQALLDLQSKTNSLELKELLKKIRVYDDAGQDNAGAWIAKTFPTIHYQRSQKQVFNFMNDKGPKVWDDAEYAGKGQHLWAKRNVQTNHGPLGELYPTRMRWNRPDLFHTLEGGGTSTWIGHVNQGLYVPEEITWGGWGGRFSAEKHKNVLADQLRWADLVETENQYKPFFMYVEVADKWTDKATGSTYNDIGTPIYRWREAYQNDFEARMDWCIAPYEKANHNPVATVNGDASDGIIYYAVESKMELEFDASISKDPDDDDLQFNWYYYPEAGTYGNQVTLLNSNTSKATLKVPFDASGSQIHIILEVKDKSAIVPLFDYRRIVVNVLGS